MILRPLCAHLAFSLLLFGSDAAAQHQSSRGGATVVEILGLRTWTREMVEDAVAKYAPGISLEDRSCAVLLRDSVGFADAASMRLSMRDTTWVILPVIEPRMKERVQFRTYVENRPKAELWADIYAILEQHPAAMSPLQHPTVLLGQADSVLGRPVSEEALQLRRVLRAHDSARDWDLARSTILSDSNHTNRAAAALVLSNYPERDSTFYLLAEGIRAKDVGAAAAQMVLSALAEGTQRRVNWAPAREALEALVGGTNLFAYPRVLQALVATDIRPDLGRHLALVNGGLLLDHLGARNPLSPPPAHEFLVHVSGQDLGRDPGAWRDWFSTL